jgi:hypothetical protein
MRVGRFLFETEVGVQRRGRGIGAGFCAILPGPTAMSYPVICVDAPRAANGIKSWRIECDDCDAWGIVSMCREQAVPGSPTTAPAPDMSAARAPDMSQQRGRRSTASQLPFLRSTPKIKRRQFARLLKQSRIAALTSGIDFLFKGH